MKLHSKQQKQRTGPYFKPTRTTLPVNANRDLVKYPRLKETMIRVPVTT